jgi:hypothetical protein
MTCKYNSGLTIAGGNLAMPPLCRTATRMLVAIGLAMLSAGALAQTDAATAATPKPPCAKPGEYPGRLGTDRARKAWQDELSAYTACMKKFVAGEQAIIEVHTKAANEAIDEHNAVVKAASDAMDPNK